MDKAKKLYEFAKERIPEGPYCGTSYPYESKAPFTCSYFRECHCDLFGGYTRGLWVGSAREENGKVEMCKKIFG